MSRTHFYFWKFIHYTAVLKNKNKKIFVNLYKIVLNIVDKESSMCYYTNRSFAMEGCPSGLRS